MAVGAIICAGEAVLCRIAGRYFKNELEAGTPFTFDGAKELLRLGIYTICIPVVTVVASEIVYQVMKHFLSNVDKLEIGNAVSVELGVMFIIMSLLCKYGAEIAKDNKENDEVKSAKAEN